jgi:transposase-like protein
VSKKQRAYTPEFREAAVAMVLTDGRTIRQAADNLDIPYHTIVQWVAKRLFQNTSIGR